MALRTCIVSYHDMNFRNSVEVVTETLHEGAMLGIKTMKLPLDMLHLVSLEIEIKGPGAPIHIRCNARSLAITAR